MKDEEKFLKWMNAGLLPPSERSHLYTPTKKPSEILSDAYDPHAHFARVKRLHEAYRYNDEEECALCMQRIVVRALEIYPCELPDEILEPFMTVVAEIMRDERIFEPEIVFPAGYPLHDQRTYLTRLEEFYLNAETIVGYYEEHLPRVFAAYFSHLPKLKESPFRVPLIHLLETPHDLIHAPHVIMHGRPELPRVFRELAKKLISNLDKASGINPEKPPANLEAKLRFAPDFKNRPLEELVELYLGGTPFAELLMTPAPFSVPEQVRFEHTHVLGGSGHGKTTLLTHQFLQDVEAENSPALIIVDGKGTFVSELQRLARFAPDAELSERLVFINPEDMHHPPALNMFSVPKRYAGYDEELRRQIENNTISLFSYIFSARDFKLSEKMNTCLSYAVRLLFSMDTTPTMFTLLDLLSEPPVPKVGGVPPRSQFLRYIEAQPHIVRRFFTDLFYHPTEYTETKRQIQNRIYSLLENPAFAAMFTAEERKLDLYDVMRERKILLVNASPSVLGEKAAPLLGRYITAMTLAAAYERLAVHRSQWTPAFLVLDEAQMFVDEDKTQPLLQQAREFNLGVVLAHQKLDDLSSKLVATVAANTSIRYVGGVSAQDASFMGRNMRCEPDFILDQRKRGDTTSFATYVRGFTERPVSLTIPLGILDKEPKMTEEEYRAVVARNRSILAATPTKPSSSPPSSTSSQAPALDDDGETSSGTW
ncbi:MAG: type IV secretion system DNA-binding domain-containing protein [Rhizobiales bacterium]|nr:type IV secretion system DNA-binding domain-containing protein [Hyphomicrobiales bacterium]